MNLTWLYLPVLISKFRLEYKDKLSSARACKIKTHHGEINTPVFMPVGTQATVKGFIKVS